MKFNYIDRKDWAREEYFNHFLNSIRCTYSNTVNIDITELLTRLKLNNLKLYPALIYMIITIVNKHNEFRMSFDKDGKLGYFSEVNPSYTVFHNKAETFSNFWTEYDNSFSIFYKNYLSDIEKYKDVNDILGKNNQPDNIVQISDVTWVNFTGFNLNVYCDGTYLLPIFTIGKYIEENKKQAV
jgi:chloramphenicol O-acetyltransferase type A